MRILKPLLGLSITASLIAALIVLFLRGRQEAAIDAEQEHPLDSPSRVKTVGGQPFIVLDAAAQSRSGIGVTVFRATNERPQIRATAVVLPVQNLTELRTNYLSARNQIQKANNAISVSKPAYERLKQLYENDQNAAAKRVQESEAAWHSDELSLSAANDALHSTEMLVRQTWGETVFKWFADDSPDLDRALTRQDILLQVSYMPGALKAPPQAASVQSPNGKMQSADLISVYPSVDPRIQEPSFLYRTSAAPDLVPGMTLVVLFPIGPVARSVVVPENAVVWWQGKAWVYVQTGADRFERHEVPTVTPTSSGFLTNFGFAPGEKVVISGAQQILSEEFRSQIQVLSDSE